MIDLKKLREEVERADKFRDFHALETADILELLDMLEAAQKDAVRLDWIEGRTKINSKGYRSEGMQQDFDAKFVVMPSWYQRGSVFNSLREAIDAAMQS